MARLREVTYRVGVTIRLLGATADSWLKLETSTGPFLVTTHELSVVAKITLCWCEGLQRTIGDHPAAGADQPLTHRLDQA